MATVKKSTSRSSGKTQIAIDGDKVPRLPHEHDESSDSGTSSPRESMRKAHDDVVSGKRETDRGEATDALYEATLRGKMPGKERD